MCNLTSVPICRNAHRNDTKRRYFKFKRLEICELIEISDYFHFSALYASPEHSYPTSSENYYRVVTALLNLRRASFYPIREPLDL